MSEHADGYSASGEGQFSRRAAHSDYNPHLTRYKPAKGEAWSDQRLIAKHSHDLAKLKDRLPLVHDLTLREKITRNIRIKSEFIQKLRART